ncbi:MAG: DMT family transporter [Leptothrix ochracea]|uniref:DMT family transporter n=1 Tax=Leptothrix ochracea TaxID=735331 RepID=UPI0034E1A8EC
MSHPLTPRVIAFLSLPPLLWAGNAVVGRMAVGSVPPLMLNALRWLFVLLILAVLGRRAIQQRSQWLALLRRWRYLAPLGLFGVGAYNALQYLALTTSTPINVTLIAASMPIWMLVVGALGYGVRPRRLQMLGALLSLAGVAVVLGRGDLDVLRQVHIQQGDLWMLLAAASWSIYSWMLVRPPASMQGAARPQITAPDHASRPWSWSEWLLVQTLFGLVWAGSAAGLEQLISPRDIAWSSQVLIALAYIVIGPSIIAYWFWGRGVALAGPTVAGFFSNLTPLFAALLSTTLLGEAPQWYHGVAFFLIVAGIVVSAAQPASGSTHR